MEGQNACYWIMPDSVLFPTISSVFEGVKEINGLIPKFWIQGISNEDVLDNISPLRDDPIICQQIGSVLKNKLGSVHSTESPKEEHLAINTKYTPLGKYINILETKEAQGRKALYFLNALDYLMRTGDLFQQFKMHNAVHATGLNSLTQHREQAHSFK